MSGSIRGNRKAAIKPALKWHSRNALDFVRLLESRLSDRGWHVALTGSVLQDRESRHDVDVMVYPHCDDGAARYEQVRESLRAAGLTRTHSFAEMRANWRRPDEKRVEVWRTAQGLRVDVTYWPLAYEETNGVLGPGDKSSQHCQSGPRR